MSSSVDGHLATIFLDVSVVYHIFSCVPLVACFSPRGLLIMLPQIFTEESGCKRKRQDW